MSEQVKRVIRFDDEEMSLMKNTFSDRDDILFALRKVFFQVDLTKEEKIIIETFRKNDKIIKILKKHFNPSYADEVKDNVPFFQVADILLGLNADLKEKDVNYSWPYIMAKKLERMYLSERLEFLETGKEGRLRLSDFVSLDDSSEKSSIDTFIKVTAFNHLLSYVDSVLHIIKGLSGVKEETIEETKNRLLKDSSK